MNFDQPKFLLISILLERIATFLQFELGAVQTNELRTSVLARLRLYIEADVLQIEVLHTSDSKYLSTYDVEAVRYLEHHVTTTILVFEFLIHSPGSDPAR